MAVTLTWKSKFNGKTEYFMQDFPNKENGTMPCAMDISTCMLLHFENDKYVSDVVHMIVPDINEIFSNVIYQPWFSQLHYQHPFLNLTLKFERLVE